MLNALRYWITVPEGEPDDIFEELLTRGTPKTIPVNHVMLMVAGNGSVTIPWRRSKAAEDKAKQAADAARKASAKACVLPLLLDADRRVHRLDCRGNRRSPARSLSAKAGPGHTGTCLLHQNL